MKLLSIDGSTCLSFLEVVIFVEKKHRHLRIYIDCLMARTACLVCFITTVNGRSKKNKEKKPIMSCASSGHITKLKQSIFAPFNIYEKRP